MGYLLSGIQPAGRNTVILPDVVLYIVYTIEPREAGSNEAILVLYMRRS